MEENQIEVENNGHGGYEDFLKGLSDKGLFNDAETVYKDGSPVIPMPEAKRSNASIIASVPNAQSIYDKKDKEKGVLLDLMARTNLTHNELIMFLKAVEWCEKYGLGYDFPLRYCVGKISEGGLSRQQYVDAITTYRFRNYGNNNQQSRFKQKPSGGELP